MHCIFYAFIAILVPKLVAMATLLCPLCTGVSHMNFPIAQTLSESQNQTLHGYFACNWSYSHFCHIFAYFCQNLVPWQRPLDHCNQKCLVWNGRPRKPPVISNRILLISHTNAFICIYSYFSPKIGCNGNAPLSLVYGRVTDEFLDRINPISKPNSAWMCRLQLKLWPFLWFLAYFGQNLVAMATSLRSCNQKCLIWIGRPLKPYPRTKKILSIAVTHAKLCHFVGSRQV